MRLWSEVRTDVAVLASGGEGLERVFKESEEQGQQGQSLLDLDDADGGSGDGGLLVELGRQVADIDELLGRLNKIKRERGEVLKDLKEKVG